MMRPAIDQHVSFAWLIEAGQDVDQRGLAGAVGTDHGMHFSGCEADVDTAERFQPAEAARDSFEFDRGAYNAGLTERGNDAAGTRRDPGTQAALDRPHQAARQEVEGDQNEATID